MPCDAWRGQSSSAETTTAPLNRAARGAWSHRAGYYGLALLFVAAAALLRWVVPDVLSPAPFLVFCLAWVGAAAFGGLGPGLLATVASWLCVDLLFDSTPWHLGFSETGSVGRLGVLLVGGLAVSVVGEKMRRMRIRRHRQEKELAAANTALRENEQRFRRMAESCKGYGGLVERINDWAWEVDADCVYTYASPRARELLGYAPEEIVGKTPFDFMPPDEAERVRNAFWPICRARKPLELLENTLVRKDGRLVTVETSGMPIFAEDGSFRGYTGIDRDVTSRKQAEEALRASEEKYRFLVENSKDVTWMIDLQSKWIFISSNIEKVTGYRADELIGQPIWGLLAPECHDLVRESLRRRVRGEDLPPYEVVAVGKDGRRTPFEVYVGSIIDDGGNVVGVQGVARDITERKRAEEDLRESRNRYQALIETTADFIWEMDASGKYTYCSPQMKDLWGYEPQDMIGKTPFDVMPPEDRERARESFKALARSPKPFTGLEASSYDRQGRLIAVEISGVPFFDADGRLLGYRGISRDVTERKRAREALAESRQKYRRLVEKINDWAWEIDADCVYTYASPRARELLGYAPEEIVGKTPFDFMPPDEARRVRSAFASVWRARKPLELLENTLVRQDGRLVTVETSGMPVFAEDGSFRGYTGIDRDVTERKQAEETLRRAKTFTDRLLDAPFDTVFVFEPVTGKPVRWNERFVEVSGYDDEEIAGMKAPDDFYDENDLKRARECMGRILDDGQGTVELSLITKQGVRIPFEYAATVVEDEEGKTLLLAVGRDITERKQAEEALRESEERFRIMADGSPNPIWVTDAEGERIFANRQYLEYFGISAEEMKGGEWEPFVHPDDAPRYVNSFQSSLQEHRSFFAEARVKRADGQWRWIESHAKPRFTSEGEFLGFVGITQDITDRKQAEEALREWNTTLESRVAERTEALEHRARQLQKLTLELSETEERERRRLAELLHDDLQQVLAAAKFHLSRVGSRTRSSGQSQEIIEQVKEMLKDAIERSRDLSHELSPVVLYHGDVAETLGWLAEQMQAKHGLTVHVEVLGEIKAQSDVVKTFVYRAAQELLFNVVKHARVHEARIRIRRLGRYLCLSVSDRGRGFDPQEIKETAGFGLLSIRERVALLGGRMKTQSVKGRGTTFRIVVPDAELFPTARQ